MKVGRDQGLPPRPDRRAAHHPVPREPDMACFLGDVDLHEPRDDGLQVRVVAHLTLQGVEQFLADEGDDPQQCAAHRHRKEVHDGALPGTHHVWPGPGALDHFAEHRHVPALIAHLGEFIVRGGGRRVGTHQPDQQCPVEQVLEPDAHRQHIRHLLTGEFDPLRNGHRPPQVGPVEREHLRG